MRCSCGGIFRAEQREIMVDGRHGEIAMRTVYVCSDCGRELRGERALVRTQPTKEEREI